MSSSVSYVIVVIWLRRSCFNICVFSELILLPSECRFKWLSAMTKRFVPKGVMPALVTPFTRDGDLIEDAFKQLIDYTIKKGVTGIVPAGTTGEFVYMRTEERKKLLRLAVEFADGRVPVIAGTGYNSTRATLSLTKYAAEIGCDAALVVSPFYLRPSDKGYYEHYATLASKGDIPIIVYNIPQCTLGVLSPSLVEDLADLDNIVGIKDSSGNIGYTLELIERVGNKIPVLIGHDECVLSAIAAGAGGAILASANLIPHLWAELINKVHSGHIKDAMRIQHSVQTLCRIITRNGGAPPVKAALNMMGINAGFSRLPLDTGGTLTAELSEEIRIELEKLGLIPRLDHSGPAHLDLEEMAVELGLDRSYFDGVRQATAESDTVSVAIATGPKNGPLGLAFVRLLTTPLVGHEGVPLILEPNLAVRPSGVVVSARRIETPRHASLFYGPVQSGAARAVADHIEALKIPQSVIDNNVIVMVLDVDLNTRDRRVITSATREAVSKALSMIWR